MITLLSYLRWNQHSASRFRSVIGKLWIWRLPQIISMHCVVRSVYAPCYFPPFVFMMTAYRACCCLALACISLSIDTQYWGRTQIHREFRKPLIVMAPKNLLRHKDFRSSLSEFDEIQDHPGLDDEEGSRFKRLIPDHHKQIDKGISRFILCSGQVSRPVD